ncbi:hypothetical protein SH528x_003197 [Novipirellula sp. SH528]|uniref:hypothetical protein n=1 Tax=Novipirellula sp. SH528 TaxID=3454466 RepID=UPI003F9F02AD
MKAKRTRRMTALLVALAAVVGAFSWLNSLTLIVREEGASLTIRSGLIVPIRLSRSNGWPSTVWVRSNWATRENGHWVFDEDMRSKESFVDLLSLALNTAVLLSFLILFSTFVLAAYDRRFSLRGLLLGVLCIAVLMVLFRCSFESDMERRRRARQLESVVADLGF